MANNENKGHPVGEGVGAAGGAVTGLAVGASVCGPIGAVVGAAVGAVAGGVAGHGVAAAVNPTVENAYWSTNYQSRTIVQHGVLEPGTAFLQKPFTINALELKVREILDGARKGGREIQTFEQISLFRK